MLSGYICEGQLEPRGLAALGLVFFFGCFHKALIQCHQPALGHLWDLGSYCLELTQYHIPCVLRSQFYSILAQMALSSKPGCLGVPLGASLTLAGSASPWSCLLNPRGLPLCPCVFCRSAPLRTLVIGFNKAQFILGAFC